MTTRTTEAKNHQKWRMCLRVEVAAEATPIGHLLRRQRHRARAVCHCCHCALRSAVVSDGPGHRVKVTGPLRETNTHTATHRPRHHITAIKDHAATVQLVITIVVVVVVVVIVVVMVVAVPCLWCSSSFPLSQSQ